jgi:tetratricopeptide (TPR) repeat protein
MEAAWAAGKALYLSGPPGVGKTRLMLEFAQSKGPLLLLQGRPSDTGIPYAFHTRAIRQSLARFPSLELPPWVRREVSRLVPELEGEPPPPITSEGGKLRLLEAISEVIRALAQQGVTIIVADDLQFVSDAASNEVAAYAMTRLLPEGVFHPLTAFRREELDPLILKAILQQVERGQAVLIELEPLSETDLLRMVRAMSGSSGAIRFTQRLHQATGGNPLFVLETLKALFESGALQVGPEGWRTPYDQETEDYRELPLPASVREAVTRRLQGLGAAPRRLLEAASLAGDGFSLEELEGATALSEWESLEALEQALAANLLQQQGPAYAFSHDLVRRSIREGMGAQRRQLLHRKLAQSLERQSGNPARIAEHWEEGGKPQAAIPWRIRAAEAAVRVYAHREALKQYGKALADGAQGGVAFAIHAERARLWAGLDEREHQREELQTLSALAAQLGQGDLEAKATLAWAGFYNNSGRYPEALEQAEQALQHLQLSPLLTAQAHHQAGLALMMLGRLAEAEPRLEAALQAALPQEPDPEALVQRGQLHLALCNCALQRGDLDSSEGHTEAALKLFRQAQHRRGEVEAWSRQGLLEGLRGRTQEAIHTLERAQTEAQAIGEPALERSILLNLFKFQFESGQLEAALPHLERGLMLAREPQDPRLEGIFLNNLGVVYRAKGELGKALESFRGALEIAERFGMAPMKIRRQITLAENYLDLGSVESARPLLQQAVQQVEASGLGELRPWLEAQQARCELMEGFPTAALARLEPWLNAGLADHNDQDRIAWLVGQARLALNQPQQALEAVAQRAALPAFRVRLLAVQLEARRVSGQPLQDDLAEAAELLEEPDVALLESLELRQAAIRALRQTGQAEQVRQAEQVLQAQLGRIAAGLEGYPGLKEAFTQLGAEFL